MRLLPLPGLGHLCWPRVSQVSPVTRPGPLLIANCSVVRAANTTPVKNQNIFINICIDLFTQDYIHVHNGRANAGALVIFYQVEKRDCPFYFIESK